MQNNKKLKWTLFAGFIMTVCFMAQFKLQAESADTFISPESVWHTARKSENNMRFVLSCWRLLWNRSRPVIQERRTEIVKG